MGMIKFLIINTSETAIVRFNDATFKVALVREDEGAELSCSDMWVDLSQILKFWGEKETYSELINDLLPDQYVGVIIDHGSGVMESWVGISEEGLKAIIDCHCEYPASFAMMAYGILESAKVAFQREEEDDD